MSEHTLNRRTFLKGALVAGGGLTIGSAVVRSFAAIPASNTLNLALIGCGSRAGAFLPHIPAGVNLLATVDPIKERRDDFAQRYNQARGDTHCKAYNDFREVIGRKDIDGILVITPDHWHVPIAMEAARNNKHMYVEKPLGVSLEDQFRLREMFKGKNLVFQYGTQQRSSLFARTAIDLVQNGYIGEIEEVDVWAPGGVGSQTPFTEAEQSVPEGVAYDLYVGPSELLPFHPARVTRDASWFNYNYAIGFIAGWGSHPLDICQWGLDMDSSGPVHFEGTGVVSHPQALFNTTYRWDVYCRYPNGVKMRFMDEDTAKPVVEAYSQGWQGNGTVFKGTEGWVQFSRGAIYFFKNGAYVPASQISFRETDHRTYVSDDHLGNFIDCIRNRRPTISPLESAIRSDTISHLADIAVRTGKPVEWDPESEQLIEGTPDQRELLLRPMREPYVF